MSGALLPGCTDADVDRAIEPDRDSLCEHGREACDECDADRWPVCCAWCSAQTGTTTVEGSSSICPSCLDQHFPEET